MGTKIIPKFREKPKRRSVHNKKSHGEYVIELAIKNPNVVALEKYVSARTPIYHKCLTHNYEWKASPSNILKGQGCKLCKAEKTRTRDVWSNERYINELNNVNKLVIPLENYVNARYPIWHWFSECGHLNRTSPESILRKGTCLKCSGIDKGNALRRTHEEFITRLNELNPYVKSLSEYKGCFDNMYFKCLRCGHLWSATPNSVLRGSGCPICCLSHGEKQIIKILNKYNISYIPQHHYDGLIGVGGGNLLYDFYLPKFNMLIEFQGEQHERPAFGEEQFIIQKEHDRRKREYAKGHKIRLLEIWYYDCDRIEEILKENLNLETLETDIGA